MVSPTQMRVRRFSNNEVYAESDARARGEGYRLASEALLNVRDISMVTVQTCILLGAYAAANGDTDVENIYYTLAGRMSLALDLPNRPVMSLLEREINIRGTQLAPPNLADQQQKLTQRLYKYGGQSAWLMYGHRLQ